MILVNGCFRLLLAHFLLFLPTAGRRRSCPSRFCQRGHGVNGEYTELRTIAVEHPSQKFVQALAHMALIARASCRTPLQKRAAAVCHGETGRRD